MVLIQLFLTLTKALKKCNYLQVSVVPINEIPILKILLLNIYKDSILLAKKLEYKLLKTPIFTKLKINLFKTVLIF